MTLMRHGLEAGHVIDGQSLVVTQLFYTQVKPVCVKLQTLQVRRFNGATFD
jgi:hypothetical protein